MMNERNPEDGKRFINIIKLRTAKIMNFNKLKNIVKNVVYINYEDLLQEPRMLRKICNRYDIKMNNRFRIINDHFGGGKGKFKAKEYYLNKEFVKEISKDDLVFINSQLDERIEQSINYELLR